MWRTIKNMIRPCLRIWEWEWSEGYFLSGEPVVHVHNQLCLALQRDFYIMTLSLPPPPPHTTANSLAHRRFMAATSSQKCTFASSSPLFTAAALRRAPLSSSRRTTVGRRGVRGVARHLRHQCAARHCLWLVWHNCKVCTYMQSGGRAFNRNLHSTTR